jgi:hypothetical protein
MIFEIKLLQLACITYDIDPFEHFVTWRGSVKLRGNVGPALCSVRVNLVSSQETVLHPDSVTCCYLVNAGNLGFCFQATQEMEGEFQS